MAGTFEVYQDRAGEFRFRLKASNGLVVSAGQGYDTKAGGDERVYGGAECRGGRGHRRTWHLRHPR